MWSRTFDTPGLRDRVAAAGAVADRRAGRAGSDLEPRPGRALQGSVDQRSPGGARWSSLGQTLPGSGPSVLGGHRFRAASSRAHRLDPQRHASRAHRQDSLISCRETFDLQPRATYSADLLPPSPKSFSRIRASGIRHSFGSPHLRRRRSKTPHRATAARARPRRAALPSTLSRTCRIGASNLRRQGREHFEVDFSTMHRVYCEISRRRREPSRRKGAKLCRASGLNSLNAGNMSLRWLIESGTRVALRS